MAVRTRPQVKPHGHPGLAVCAFIAAGLILSGCDAGRPRLPGVEGAYSGPGERLASAGVTPDLSSPSALVFADQHDLIVTTFGSSSCPAVPEMTAIDERRETVHLTLTVFGADGACTADSSERTFRFVGVGDFRGYIVEVAHV